MKKLSIFRHAKARRPEKYPQDFDRPLTKRGHQDTRRMARLVARLSPPVDRIVSSPALRTRETTEGLAAALNVSHAITWDERIYEASAETLLTVLGEVPGDAEHVVLVGHNPGMEALVSGLCAGDPARLNLKMPTAGLAHLELEIFWWHQIRWGCGQLQLLAAPKQLSKLGD
ncbi:histidine phosphatase family protein [Litorilinea aerophila]|uniref:Histidine phosphatase family protein n=1 Tax=Litorilinea aerophila TaxID=1204385 RepID=A0A540VA36_9CHLR|nr:histidine phosphatase family protein [Litorilinea aerophila]MCC9078567.1 histidine phosphatase family protein [Litorilinea aerophila]OUC05738.1 hypothetical protein RY27_25380 [Litorilinea aerophila]